MAAPKGNRNHLKHGLSHTRIDNIYKSMISRCYNKNNNRYERYGGRDIKVCDEWLNDKTKFFIWAFSNGYKDGLTIDRIKVDEDYSPCNCRWATQKEQQNNRSNTIHLTVDGVTHTISEWSEITGIKRATIWSRLSKGYSPKLALKAV